MQETETEWNGSFMLGEGWKQTTPHFFDRFILII